MRAAGHAVAMQSAKAERRLINGDQSRSKIERTTTTVHDGRQRTWPTTRLMGLAPITSTKYAQTEKKATAEEKSVIGPRLP